MWEGKLSCRKSTITTMTVLYPNCAHKETNGPSQACLLSFSVSSNFTFSAIQRVSRKEQFVSGRLQWLAECRFFQLLVSNLCLSCIILSRTVFIAAVISPYIVALCLLVSFLSFLTSSTSLHLNKYRLNECFSFCQEENMSSIFS